MSIHSELETIFALHFAATYPDERDPERQFYFARPLRMWRFDFAWPSERVALEIQGGHWTNGRHTRGKGFREDCEKLSAAATRGWCVILATSDMVRSGEASHMVMTALHEARNPVLRRVIPEQPKRRKRARRSA